MISRTILVFGVALLTAVWLGAGAAAAARAGTHDAMRASVMALRGIIDRHGAAHFFEYPSRREVRPGGDLSSWWPPDPWTGGPLSPGTSRGRYSYTRAKDRRSYRLTGFLGGGRMIVVTGGMPRDLVLAYDHRSEEGIHLIRQYVEDNAASHGGLYPLPVDVSADGAVGTDPVRRYWPSNPWDHAMMAQRGDSGSFSYSVAPDRRSYTLRLHRALKRDMVLGGARVTSPWQVLLTVLEDRMLRRGGRVLAGYVDQWARQRGGSLPLVTELAPDGAVGASHTDWPRDPGGGGAMRPGTAPGAYTYAPGPAGAYKLIVHLHSGDARAGGVVRPARSQPRPLGLVEP
jgi:hypothetical protein